MERERHIQFVTDSTELADKEGKAASAIQLDFLARMLSKSGGSVDVFVKMAITARPLLVKKMIQSLGTATLKAKTLGREFGEEKMNGVNKNSTR